MALTRTAILLATAGCVYQPPRLQSIAALPEERLVVVPVYPQHGANWNDYVSVTAPGQSFARQPDLACTGDEAGDWRACLHGGELKRVAVEGESDCAPLVLEELLGAFDWICTTDTGTATYLSTGLRPDKGLADLIDFATSAWKPNLVTIRKNGEAILSSPAGQWWRNPVQALPDNREGSRAVLGMPGTIYILPASRVTSGYNLDADGAAMVTAPGTVLTYNGADLLNCDDQTGEAEPASSICLLAAGAQRFLWLEGSFADGPADHPSQHPALLRGLRFSQVRHLHGAVPGSQGIELVEAHNNRLVDVTLVGSDVTERGLFLDAASGNDLRHIVVVGGDDGILLNASNDNHLHGVRVAAVVSEAITVENGSSRNVLTDLSLADAKWEGIWVIGETTLGNTIVGVTCTATAMCVGLAQGAGQTTVSHVTTGNGLGDAGYGGGLYVGSNPAEGYPLTTASVFNQAVAINSGGDGFVLNDGDNLLSQIVVSHSDGYGIRVAGGANVFTHAALLGDNVYGDCGVDSGLPAPGLDTECRPQGNSDVVATTGVALADSFVAKVQVDDRQNISDDNGAGVAQRIIDWSHFESWFRAWGPDGDAFPNASNRGSCINDTPCRIWDWRLRASDSWLHKRSGDGVAANAEFIAGAPCPAAATGDYVLTDKQVTSNTFLVNATEITLDDVGDDDGLCESGERCLYSPNFGSYQGEGDYLATGPCMFTDGAVSGVTLYAYPVNGEGS
jgi:hypothetical protein